ncbi:DUF1127 domain-containing protein [Kiloniella sp.]|uniref:DUF1127 domain-containing protein n=1 Tax=Kiloniella sp. TaxID=1938587 RepID=UPI003B01616E
MANVSMHKTYTFGELHNDKLNVPFLMAPFVAVIETLVAWQERLSVRDTLRDQDAHLLSDMGISIEEARSEAAKPFWIN